MKNTERNLIEMPLRLPGDHEHVLHLCEESERMATIGNRWLKARTPNPIAAEFCLRNAWAFALAAAHLRCWMKGELENKPKRWKPKQKRNVTRGTNT